MADTLSNGYKRSLNGETDWWTHYTFNIERVNDHTHDGTSSTKINTKDLTRHTQVVSNASWIIVSSGNHYSKNFTVPAGYDASQCVMTFFDQADNVQIFPTVTRVNATTFKLEVSEPLNILVVYA